MLTSGAEKRVPQTLVDSNNDRWRREDPFLTDLGPSTYTIQDNLDGEVCVELWQDIVAALVYDADVMRLHGVARVGPKRSWQFQGGWEHLYEHVNVLEMQPDVNQQRLCVFAFYARTTTANTIKNLRSCFPAAGHLIDEATEKVQRRLANRKAQIELAQAHYLFGWNAHAQFSAHVDDPRYRVSYTATLSPGQSSMHVIVARSHAMYLNPGDAHMFDGQMQHASSETQLRTVKVTLFFEVVEGDVTSSSHDVDASKKPEVVDLVSPSPPSSEEGFGGFGDTILPLLLDRASSASGEDPPAL